MPVSLAARVTEVGTVELWCQSRTDDRRWRLQIQLRGPAGQPTPQGTVTGRETDRVVIEQSVIDAAVEAIRAAFQAGTSSPPDAPGPARVIKRLEEVLEEPRDQWPPSALRAFWEPLKDLADHRLKSPAARVALAQPRRVRAAARPRVPARRGPDQGALADLLAGRPTYQGSAVLGRVVDPLATRGGGPGPRPSRGDPSPPGDVPDAGQGDEPGEEDRAAQARAPRAGRDVAVRRQPRAALARDQGDARLGADQGEDADPERNGRSGASAGSAPACRCTAWPIRRSARRLPSAGFEALLDRRFPPGREAAEAIFALTRRWLGSPMTAPATSTRSCAAGVIARLVELGVDEAHDPARARVPRAPDPPRRARLWATALPIGLRLLSDAAASAPDGRLRAFRRGRRATCNQDRLQIPDCRDSRSNNLESSIWNVAILIDGVARGLFDNTVRYGLLPGGGVLRAIGSPGFLAAENRTGTFQTIALDAAEVRRLAAHEGLHRDAQVDRLAFGGGVGQRHRDRERWASAA